MPRYELNENVFDTIDTEEKAYWLGFIIADGSIQVRKSGQCIIKLALCSEDYLHLEKWKKFLQTKMPIKNYIVGNGKNNNKTNCCELTITSKNILQALAKYGIGPQKSHTVEIPEIPSHLVRHLLRGIWDGDGSVLYRTPRKKYPNNFIPEVQICGNEKILNKINDIFYTELNLKKSKLSKVSSIFLFRKQTRSAQKVINFLYKDSSIYLDRKYKKALLGMNWEAKR